MALTFEDGPDWSDENGVRLGSYQDFVDSLGTRTGFKRGKPRVSAPKAVAYVNHGRWVVDCPLGDGGARRANPAYDFFCIECGNTFVVEWPDKKTMESIATLLEHRPNPVHQNFTPVVDSVASLRAENVEHGVAK